MKLGTIVLGCSAVITVIAAMPAFAAPIHFSAADASVMAIDFSGYSIPADADHIQLNITNVSSTAEIYAKPGGFRPVVSGTLDLPEIRFWTESADLIGDVLLDGDEIAVAQSVASTAVNKTLKTGTWTGNGTISYSLADLNAIGVDITKPFTLYLELVGTLNSSASLGWKGTLDGDIDLTFTTIPEVASMGVLGLGSAGLMLLRRRK